MAVKLFKDGESLLVAPQEVAYYIDAGWDPQDPACPRFPPPFTVPANATPAEARRIVLGAMHIRVD